MVAAIVAIGGNIETATVPLWDRLTKTLDLLPEKGLQIRALSHWYQTPAYPKGSGSRFLNAALRIETICDPQEILQVLAEVETAAGRTREARWGPRVVDLDLVDVNGCVLPDMAEQTRWRALEPQDQARLTPRELILPHPRLQDRNFVLYPMRDVAPDWQHPVTGEGIDAMIAALPAAAHGEISLAPRP